MYLAVYLGSFTDDALLNNGIRGEILWLDNITLRVDLPVFLVQIELRNQVDELHICFPVRAECTDILPVAVVFICKETFSILVAIRDDMLTKITSALILHVIERFF